jgi:Uma2 family endonuclease
MTTAALPTPGTPVPVAPTIDPRPVKWTRDDFYHICGLDSFQSRKIMLIDGEILEMAYPSALASISHALTEEWLRHIFPRDRFWVRGQLGLYFGINTDPVPDIAVVAGTPRQHAQHPQTALLVVEVADTSVAFDTGVKASLYAAAGIKDYWVIDVNDRRIHVFRDPQPDPNQQYGHGYKTVQVLGPKDKPSPLAAPTHSADVADLLP